MISLCTAAADDRDIDDKDDGEDYDIIEKNSKWMTEFSSVNLSNSYDPCPKIYPTKV